MLQLVAPAGDPKPFIYGYIYIYIYIYIHIHVEANAYTAASEYACAACRCQPIGRKRAAHLRSLVEEGHCVQGSSTSYKNVTKIHAVCLSRKPLQRLTLCFTLCKYTFLVVRLCMNFFCRNLISPWAMCC